MYSQIMWYILLNKKPASSLKLYINFQKTKQEFSKSQRDKILQIVSSKKTEKGFVTKEEVKKLLKKSSLNDEQAFSSDLMSDIFDLMVSLDGANKNYIDLISLKNYAKLNGIEFDERENDEELQSMLTLINKKNTTGQISKAEFLKLRNFL